jgi:hypothetical protein
VLSHKVVGGEEVLYCTARVATPAGGAQLLLELRFVAGAAGVQASLTPFPCLACGPVAAGACAQGGVQQLLHAERPCLKEQRVGLAPWLAMISGREVGVAVLSALQSLSVIHLPCAGLLQERAHGLCALDIRGGDQGSCLRQPQKGATSSCTPSL